MQDGGADVDLALLCRDQAFEVVLSLLHLADAPAVEHGQCRDDDTQNRNQQLKTR
jgi:hypothetical protein